MTGRNNKPDNDGPASSPARLDQFGDRMATNDQYDHDNIEACEDEDNDLYDRHDH